MPIQPPNLDDRTYEDLRRLALEHVHSQLGADWNDLTPGDPGVVLLELFAYLTDQLIYRLNRVPEKVYVSLLRLLGVSLFPPVAATVRLRFCNGQERPLTVPAQTIVTTDGGAEAPLFTTVEELMVPAKGEAVVWARHCMVYREGPFVATGAPGFSVTVQQRPIVAPTRDGLALRVQTRENGRLVDWQEVTNFSNVAADTRAFVVDRQAGIIWFAPAAQLTKQVLEVVERRLTQLRQAKSRAQKRAALQKLTAALDEAVQYVETAPQSVQPSWRRRLLLLLTQIEPVLGQLEITDGTLVAAEQMMQQAQTRLANENEAAVAAAEVARAELTLEAEALAAVPAKDVEVFVSYPGGGGFEGNVAAETLTVIRPDVNQPDLALLTVTNLEPAVGGRAGETLSNALVRGPQEMYALERAITARDFERLAEKGDGIARATAFTQAMRWVHGTRGVVEIHLVPQLTEPDKGVVEVTAAKRAAGEDIWELIHLRGVLLDSQPLGTAVLLRWAQYKEVWVEADILVKERQSEQEVRERINGRLQQLLDPLANDEQRWYFGQPLYASDAYRVILADPAVERVTRLALRVATAPNHQVRTLVADQHQPHSWYAGSGNTLFRSFNDGEGWEVATAFPKLAANASIALLSASPLRPGLVVAWVEQWSDSNSLLGVTPYVSVDCGESWHPLQTFEDGRVEDMAWLARGDVPIMVLATDSGLYKCELTLISGDPPQGAYAIIDEEAAYAVATLAKDGQVYVAVARKQRRGVWLANAIFLIYDLDLRWDQAVPEDAAHPEKKTHFQPLVGKDGGVSIAGEDIRSLTVQVDRRTNKLFLWAGAMATGWEGASSLATEQNAGVGAFRWEFATPQPLLGHWESFGQWVGGSCRGVAFVGTTVLAASQWGGVLRLDAAAPEPVWQQTNSVVLPRRAGDVARNFKPLLVVAANGEDEERPLALVAGNDGIYLTADKGENFSEVSRTSFDYRVTLPENWLFVPGQHQIRTPNSGEVADERA